MFEQPSSNKLWLSGLFMFVVYPRLNKSINIDIEIENHTSLCLSLKSLIVAVNDLNYIIMNFIVQTNSFGHRPNH